MQIVMGTTLSIRLGGSAANSAALDAAFEEVGRLDQLLSDWKPDSELSRFNARAGGESVELGPELLELVRDAHAVTLASAGAFDISVGPLVGLWRRCEGQGRLPTDAESADALAHSGARHLELDLEHGRARFDRTGCALDLGAIGKGYALERAAALLVEHGVRSALLDFGGQILALGAPPDANGWRVRLCDPRPPEGAEAEVLEIVLKDESISTSADTERALLIAGQRYSHHVDPRSGRPVEGMLAVFVVNSRARDADAWSTALFVLGVERGTALASERGLTALLIGADGREHATKTMSERLVRTPLVQSR